MSKKFKAALYMRISYTDDKTKESESLSNQRMLIDNFLKDYPDIEVVSEKLDDGYTGLLFDRPAFKEMMTEIFEEKINCVIVKDLSRLGREYIETGNYLRNIFPEYGVRFIAITDGIDTLKDSDLGGKLDVTLKTIMNDAYSRDISKKTRSALKMKRKNGEYIGSSPVYGYIKTEENKNQLTVDPYASEIVKDIFKWKKEGLSAYRIADKLNKLGVLSPVEYKKNRGIPYAQSKFGNGNTALWSATTVIRILKDVVYTGTLIQGKETTFSYKLKNRKAKPKEEWAITYDAHKEIINREDFDLVQKIMSIDTRTAPTEESVYLFSGVLICGCCGNRLTRKTVPYKDKKYFYYYCPTGKKNGCVDSRMVKEDELTSCILDSLKSYIDNVISLDELIESAAERKINQNLIEKIGTQIADVESQIAKITSYKTSLFESLVNGIVTKAEHKDMKSGYDKELSRLKNAKDMLLKELSDVKENTSEKVKWREHFKRFEDMTQLDRIAVVQLIHSITVNCKNDLLIHFRYSSEYENAFNFINNQRKAV